eukprot:3093701-Alexandrium_andersonii.AAC.1
MGLDLHESCQAALAPPTAKKKTQRSPHAPVRVCEQAQAMNFKPPPGLLQISPRAHSVASTSSCTS